MAGAWWRQQRVNTMQTGRILSIDSRGNLQLQLPDRVIDAQVLNGGVHIGSRVSGPMQAGIQTWTCSLNRTILVNVQSDAASAAA